jgi:phenylpyruvate tautomerase PptA (4-oxalocrotonate tautomerase family)
MPVVTVEVVVSADDSLEPGLAQSLADAVGLALDSPAGHAWVRLRSVPRAHYAENDRVVEADELPVFVTVVTRQALQGTKLHDAVASLTEAVARAVRRSSANVHIEFAPAAADRLSFGGTLVR